MQHLIKFSFVFTVISLLFISAKPPKVSKTSIKTVPVELSPDKKIIDLYSEFSLKNESMPSLDAFRNGMSGYTKLKNSGKIQNSVLTIIDFSLSSSKNRMWILDLKNRKVLYNVLVAHGKNTGVDLAKNFSNVSGSHKSSLGFYLTAETYYGKHGLSLRLDGQEKGINDNARSRAIVLHGADYATPSFVDRIGRLGRSYGCPAVPSELSKEIIQIIKEKSCFFIYYPSEGYKKNSQLI